MEHPGDCHRCEYNALKLPSNFCKIFLKKNNPYTYPYRKLKKISFFCDRNIIYFVELWAIPFFYLFICWIVCFSLCSYLFCWIVIFSLCSRLINYVWRPENSPRSPKILAHIYFGSPRSKYKRILPRDSFSLQRYFRHLWP